jgi:GNAT superfamily N-acetyltransferase
MASTCRPTAASGTPRACSSKSLRESFEQAAALRVTAGPPAASNRNRGVGPSIVRVRELASLSPGQLADLVAESERGGLCFVRRLQDDWHSGANRFDQFGEAFFTAIDEARLLGVCGLNVDPYSPSPRVGRVRHLYVSAAHRHQGIGSRLVHEVIVAARHSFDRLRLRTNDPHAARFYERLGFLRCEADSSATHELDLA